VADDRPGYGLIGAPPRAVPGDYQPAIYLGRDFSPANRRGAARRGRSSAAERRRQQKGRSCAKQPRFELRAAHAGEVVFRFRQCRRAGLIRNACFDVARYSLFHAVTRMIAAITETHSPLKSNAP
jgi:hypothetical protein